MRTKLLAAAAILVAGIATSTAQSNVYSLNVVGYVNKSVPAGFSMIANPLNATNNTLGGLIQNPPNFSNFLKWNGAGFDTYTFVFGAWDNPGVTLAPGEGGFFNPGATGFTNTFVGEVLQGSLTNQVPAGFSVKSSQVPQAGTATELGITDDLSNFDNILKWTGNGYETYTLVFGNWDPSEPAIGVGESFFVNANAPTAWVRNFTVPTTP